jgi:hypothetical protein
MLRVRLSPAMAQRASLRPLASVWSSLLRGDGAGAASGLHGRHVGDCGPRRPLTFVSRHREIDQSVVIDYLSRKNFEYKVRRPCSRAVFVPCRRCRVAAWYPLLDACGRVHPTAPRQ